LVELHRVLKPTGSIDLHCYPTASHYQKVLMDANFGAANIKLILLVLGREFKPEYFPKMNDKIFH
jgi:site-specific DNA-methyltransferase (adenine-specific)